MLVLRALLERVRFSKTNNLYLRTHYRIIIIVYKITILSTTKRIIIFVRRLLYLFNFPSVNEFAWTCGGRFLFIYYSLQLLFIFGSL